MTRNARFLAFLALTLSCVFPAWAQYVSEGARGSIVGTVADVDEARSQIAVDPDQNGSRITVLSDSVSTQYNGFGGVINGQPEIFTGSQGLSNVRTGDRIEVNGRYSGTATDLFVANVVRWVDESAAPAPSGTTEDVTAPPPATQEFAAVTIYGTVTDTLANSPQLVVRDNSNRTIRLNVLEDFVVKGRTGYTTAVRLKAGDNVVIKAYRDLDGNYIAQTIRLR